MECSTSSGPEEGHLEDAGRQERYQKKELIIRKGMEKNVSKVKANPSAL